ncbi:nucleoside deaminase [uncultured Methylobacterium sp.]|jgi:tRNA(adenine34) deaminase|uniref:nucleoside deaminase n=1 Tax=uncultured Methylobacterium sp. TaxID=157278 RepID=UPI002615C2D1|nr:nucleoside deaminase [uncultured Methylobacterium sp.]
MSPMDDEAAFMRRAIALSEAAVAKGQAPFGAVVVDAAGRVVGEGHNTVRADHDPTAHGEMVALRDAWGRLGERGPLQDCTLYTSCEPCLMCTVVIAQMRLRRVVFAARGTDVPGAQRLFDADLAKAAAWIDGRPGWRAVEVEGDVMRDEALAVMRLFDWR